MPSQAHLPPLDFENFRKAAISIIGCTSIDRPGCTSQWYQADKNAFHAKGLYRRRTLIRAQITSEFDKEDACYCFLPTLWVQVIRFGSWHYRIPFWRGDQPFVTSALADEEVVSLVERCSGMGGLDTCRLEECFKLLIAKNGARTHV